VEIKAIIRPKSKLSEERNFLSFTFLDAFLKIFLPRPATQFDKADVIFSLAALMMN